ncbi:hypothetical protein LCGC14_0431270 [marine sediment metagenome]|uniref:Uncharacterized protein n=1 Tax=marine sediment metagenome TaxID=412755 RepID=A0A0F9T6A9_9ZZZZ
MDLQQKALIVIECLVENEEDLLSRKVCRIAHGAKGTCLYHTENAVWRKELDSTYRDMRRRKIL